MKSDKPDLAVIIGAGKPQGKDNDSLDSMPDLSGGGNDMPEQSPDGTIDTVPLDALAMPDDQEQMQPPEVGDEVNYSVTGKVVAIEGNQAQIERTAINGQDLQDDDKQPDDTDSDEDENPTGGVTGGTGAMLGLWLLFALLLSMTASAQSTKVEGGCNVTNALVVQNIPSKLYLLSGYNASGTAEYIQVFTTNNVPPNGAVPLFSIPVAASQFYSADFSYYGCDLDQITVVSSSTATTLTLTGNTTTFQAITKSR